MQQYELFFTVYCNSLFIIYPTSLSSIFRVQFHMFISSLASLHTNARPIWESDWKLNHSTCIMTRIVAVFGLVGEVIKEVWGDVSSPTKGVPEDFQFLMGSPGESRYRVFQKHILILIGLNINFPLVPQRLGHQILLPWILISTVNSKPKWESVQCILFMA